MATVSTFVKPVQPLKAFHAVLFDDSGVLSKINGRLVFFADSGDITDVEPADCNFLVVLGEVGLSDTQALMDKLHGGYATICTTRQQEVA